MVIAMVPARMGSQRLKQKNLRELGGHSLVAHAVRKCLRASVFDEVWVNSEHLAFEAIAREEGAGFHHRPAHLADNQATSEDFVYQFLQSHECDFLFQVHSIAPLLSVREIRSFVHHMTSSDLDVLLSCTLEQIECALDGQPVNFSYQHKTNSQDLRPVQKIIWSITGWRRHTYCAAWEARQTATYAGKLDVYPVSRMAGMVVKTEEDFRIISALWPCFATQVYDQ